MQYVTQINETMQNIFTDYAGSKGGFFSERVDAFVISSNRQT